MANGEEEQGLPGIPGVPALTEEQIAQMFSTGATQPSPIGAPEQFFTPTYQGRQLPGERLPPGFKPWRVGDEALPGTWNPRDKARLQGLLAAAGLYGREGYRPGDWTGADAQALRTVLEFANFQGIDDINDAVRRFAETATTETTAGPRAPRAPLVVRVANPESVRQVVRRSSLDLLGRRLSDEEEANLVAGFQAQYTGAQRAGYGAEETGGQVVEPLSPEEYATSQLEGRVEAGDQRYLDAFERIAQTAAGTFLPGPTPTGRGGVR